MKTDYKFWYIRRDDFGVIEEAAIRFHEGDFVTVDGEQVYKREKRLKANQLKHLKSNKTKKELSGEDTIIYNQTDFGTISTDDELRTFLNGEVKKDKKRQVIDEQITK